MRILWIEDFGKTPEPFDNAVDIFEDLLSLTEAVRSHHWDKDEIELRETPAALLEFCQNYSATHEVILCRHYHDFEETIANYTLLQPEKHQHLYKLFIRNLAHEWDAAYPDNLPRCEKGDKDCFQARTVKYTFGWIMKCARNWAAHTTMLDELTEPDVAFLFMVAMRATFQLPAATEKYESILLNLFDKTDSSAMKNKIGTTPMNTQLPLSRTYLTVKNQIFQTNSADTLYFHAMLNNMINNQVEFDYVTGLFQMFWHGLSPVRLYDRGTTIDNNQNVVFKYSFWLNAYGKKEQGFLFELARSIYNRSFNKR